VSCRLPGVPVEEHRQNTNVLFSLDASDAEDATAEFRNPAKSPLHTGPPRIALDPLGFGDRALDPGAIQLTFENSVLGV
jgi:hypothetical protein